MNRRRFLETSAGLTSLGATSQASASAPGERRLALRLTETAGIRRFGYPVSTQLPADLSATRFRLTKDGREIPAQFRRGLRPRWPRRGGPRLQCQSGPLRGRELRSHRRRSRPSQPRTARRHELSTRGTERSTCLMLHTSRTRSARISPVSCARSGIPALEFLKPNSPGLFVGSRGRKTYLDATPGPTAKPPRVQVARQGPMAAGLSFDHAIQLDEKSHLASSIAMTFPSSKSWVEVVWTIADPEDRIDSMGLDLDLRLEGEPILIDCGARSTVYTTLEPRERIVFEAGHPLNIQGRELEWAIRKGSSTSPLLLEAAGEKRSGREPEGWVHVMDRTRCTAMAIADFGRPSQAQETLDRFEIEANGLLRFERRFRPEQARTQIREATRLFL